MKKHTMSQSEQSFLTVMHPNAAGVDVGSREHYVAVPAHCAQQPVRSFGCYTSCLHEAAKWLKECGVDTVAMESTGVYWIPLFEVLEDYGFEVILVDGRQTKNVAGRKTDVQDCQWIQQLHTYGLLSAAFRPERDIAALRSLCRHRASLVESCSREIHLMQKALEQMNVQLHKAVSDITGVTGLAIIEGILSGERDPIALARLRHPYVKKSESEIAQSLTGTYRSEHMFALRQSYQGFHFFQNQLAQCDTEIQMQMSTLASKAAQSDRQDSVPSRPLSRRKNQPHFDQRTEQIRITGVDMTKIPGISTHTAQVILTECGTNMEAFATEKHFASWLGLCPNNRKTGGAIRGTRTRKVASRAAHALRVAAQSLHKSKTALGAYYRRMRTRLGAPKAITATAHKLARIIYRILKYGEEYVENGQDYYEQRYKQRVRKNLIKTASIFNLKLVDRETGEVVS